MYGKRYIFRLPVAASLHAVAFRLLRIVETPVNRWNVFSLDGSWDYRGNRFSKRCRLFCS